MENANLIFNAFVEIFEAVCRATGWRYEELNILIYSLLTPASWWLILWLRTRRFVWLGLLHLGSILWYWLERQRFTSFSKWFYDENTAALLRLGGGTEEGYVRVSLWIGVAIPLAIWLALAVVPKRLAGWVYGLSVVANLIWYVWATG